MEDAFAIAIQSAQIDDFADFGPRVARAASRAINSATRRARTESAKLIRDQVALPASYLGPAGGRLTVTKFASEQDLSAVVTGRHRATSLARFAKTTKVGGQRGARVEVQPGLTRFLPRAFFINLRSGNTDTKNNVGLAIRLPAGKVPSRAYKPTKIGNGLWLIYGPSVSQVFDDVAVAIGPETADYLGQEFLRQMGLDG